jgi:hypothetical protein
VPATAPLLVQSVAAPVVTYLNSFSGGRRLHLPLSTTLTQAQIEAVQKEPALTGLAKYFVAQAGEKIVQQAKAGITAEAQKIGEQLKEQGAAAAKEGWSSFSSWLGVSSSAPALTEEEKKKLPVTTAVRPAAANSANNVD